VNEGIGHSNERFIEYPHGFINVHAARQEIDDAQEVFEVVDVAVDAGGHSWASEELSERMPASD
jgi:hypothetical protein